jgi:hypothetical protein
MLVVVATLPMQQETPVAIPGADTSVETAVERAQAQLAAVDGRIEIEPGSVGLRIERLAHLYVLGVEDRTHLDEGDAEILRIHELTEAPEPWLAATLTAYAGAYEVVRAKHASWPFHKLGHANRGLADLDAAVQAEPRDATIRYLRLMSCYPLPFFFSRGESVTEDSQTLASLLAEGDHALPASRVRIMGEFLLERASLEPELARRLALAIESTTEGAQ